MFGRTGFTFVAVGERGRDGRAAFAPAAERDAASSPSTSPSSSSSPKPWCTFVNIEPDAIGATTASGRLPAELLGDLERERLRAFRVVRAELDVHERPVELERQLDA